MPVQRLLRAGGEPLWVRGAEVHHQAVFAGCRACVERVNRGSSRCGWALLIHQMLEEIRCQTTSAAHLFSFTCPHNFALSLSCGAIMAANLLAHSELLQMHTPWHAPSTRTACKRMLKLFNF